MRDNNFSLLSHRYHALSHAQYIRYQVVMLKVWQRDDVTTKKWTLGRRRVGAVRRFLRRRFVSLPIHGFSLRASPAVKHGVSPPGTVDEHEGRLRSTQSPRIASSASASTQSRLRRRRTMLNRGWCPNEVRVNPWRSGQTTALPSDTGGVALKASREYSPSLLLRKYSILLSRVITLITDMFSISYMQSVTTWRRDNRK